jgi:hypothetical protein
MLILWHIDPLQVLRIIIIIIIIIIVSIYSMVLLCLPHFGIGVHVAPISLVLESILLSVTLQKLKLGICSDL